MNWKTIVVLAKSYKHKNWCIAGRELIKGDDGKYKLHGWIRPTSPENDGAISAQQCMLNIGREAKVLDVVRVPIDGHDPQPAQPENFRISSGGWEYVKEFPSGRVLACVNKPADIWMENEGTTESVSVEFEPRVTQSLALIKPEQFFVTLAQEFDEQTQKSKMKIWASFNYAGKPYSGLSITDPKVRHMLKNQYPDPGDPPQKMKLKKGDEYLLCVSLGPRFGAKGLHYKFVATVFDNDGYIQANY